MRLLPLLSVAFSSFLLLPAQTTECRTNGFGRSCGPQLSGSVSTTTTQHLITFQVTNGIANGLGIWVFGLQRFAQPIPFYGCDMHVQFANLLPFTTDANGIGRSTFALPSNSLGTFYVQAASFTLSPNVLFASNGLQVECRR
jgi:hypothetical protein